MCPKRVFLCLGWLMVMALVAAACGGTGGNAPSLERAYDPAPTAVALVDPYPVPNPLFTPPPDPPDPAIDLQEGVMRDDRPTPFPTFTPRPTPTLRPGPTATPLPLRTPASSAAGVIMYFAWGDQKPTAIYALRVGEDGSATGDSTLLKEELPKSSWPIQAFPAPDGSRIVFEHMGGFFVFYPANGKVEPLFRDTLDPGGQFFNWHPDNRQIMLQTEHGPEVGIWLVDADGSGKYIVLHMAFPAPYAQGGAISPDGQTVVYSLKKGFSYAGELWLVNADGSDQRQLPIEGLSDVFSMGWSPNGRYISFVNSGVLTVIELESGSLRELSTNFAVGYDSYPVWSPDSRYLAFVAYDGPNPLTDRELLPEGQDIDVFKGTAIHLVDVETGEERPLLTDDSIGYIDPAWSPDGSQIAFTSIRSGKSEIWAVNIDGTNLRQLTVSEQPVRFPFWYAPAENLLP